MQDSDFQFIADFLKRESGIIVTKDKVYLLESRLMPVAKQNDLDSMQDLIGKLRVSQVSPIAHQIIEAMTTNETSFFRDTTPFDNLRNVIFPYFIKSRATTRSLRIWSAACSSGQEPYSVIMTILENVPELANWNIEIVATDLSEDILAQAKNGEYSQFEVQRGLPITMLVKYFAQEGEKWKIKDEIKNRIRFQKLNLLQTPYSFGTFDIVLCRNVLIYFDTETKHKILNGVYNSLSKDGVLMLGGAETVLGVTEEFKGLTGHRGIYVRDDTSFETAAAA